MIPAPDLRKLSKHPLRLDGTSEVATHVAIRHLSRVPALRHRDQRKIKTVSTPRANRSRATRLGHVKLSNRHCSISAPSDGHTSLRAMTQCHAYSGCNQFTRHCPHRLWRGWQQLEPIEECNRRRPSRLDKTQLAEIADEPGVRLSLPVKTHPERPHRRQVDVTPKLGRRKVALLLIARRLSRAQNS